MRIKNLLFNEKGLGIIQVLMLASVVAGLGAVLMKSGLIRSKMTKQARENVLIKEFVQEINSSLTDSDTCKLAMDDNFNSLGDFTIGAKIDDSVDVQFEDISLIQDLGRVKEIGVTLSKVDLPGKPRRNVIKRILVQTYVKKDSAGNDVTYCTSYENTGIEKSYKYFCGLYGGDFDDTDGSCDFTTLQEGDFKESVKQFACEVLDGELVDGKCDNAQVTGFVESNHFDRSVQVLVGATSRTDLRAATCTGLQVANSISSDSELNCLDISCPKLSTSSYVAIEDSGTIKCQCQRDSTVEKPSLACGDTDPTSCDDYTVNDGCGLGGTCQIIGGKTAGCLAPPSSCVPSCPAASDVCSGETDTRSDGCGGMCNVTGSKTCSTYLCSSIYGQGNEGDESVREVIGGPCTTNGATLARFQCQSDGDWQFVRWEGCP